MISHLLNFLLWLAHFGAILCIIIIMKIVFFFKLKKKNWWKRTLKIGAMRASLTAHVHLIRFRIWWTKWIGIGSGIGGGIAIDQNESFHCSFSNWWLSRSLSKSKTNEQSNDDVPTECKRSNDWPLGISPSESDEWLWPFDCVHSVRRRLKCGKMITFCGLLNHTRNCT